MKNRLKNRVIGQEESIEELLNTYIEDVLLDEIVNNNKNIIINSLNLVTN